MLSNDIVPDIHIKDYDDNTPIQCYKGSEKLLLKFLLNHFKLLYNTQIRLIMNRHKRKYNVSLDVILYSPEHQIEHNEFKGFTGGYNYNIMKSFYISKQ